MVNQVQNSQMVSDLKWVIAIAKSVQSKDQLLISLKCFFLWEKKYNSVFKSFPNTKFSMRGAFWAVYKNKESQFSILAPSE